jgi:hypothetical protein
MSYNRSLQIRILKKINNLKKTILFILTIINLSCSNDDNNKKNIIIPDTIIGKWIIYKAEYEHTVYEYEINGQCGQEALEMLPKYGTSYNFVIETFYTNADCTGYNSNNIGTWVKADNGVYNIYDSSTVPERTLTLSGNEIKVTEPGFITVIKYYKRAL